MESKIIIIELSLTHWLQLLNLKEVILFLTRDSVMTLLVLKFGSMLHRQFWVAFVFTLLDWIEVDWNEALFNLKLKHCMISLTILGATMLAFAAFKLFALQKNAQLPYHMLFYHGNVNYMCMSVTVLWAWVMILLCPTKLYWLWRKELEMFIVIFPLKYLCAICNCMYV